MPYVLQKVELTKTALEGDPSLHKRELRGPAITGATYASHSITLYWRPIAALRDGDVFLVERDGCDEKVFQIREPLFVSLIGRIVRLDDQMLFAVLFALCEAQRSADQISVHRERSEIFSAFAQNQLRQPNGQGVKVWITKHAHA